MRKISHLLLFALLCLAFAPVNPAHAVIDAEPSQTEIDDYRDLISQDVRLAGIGYRLAKANAAYCSQKMQYSGLILHDIAQYADPQFIRHIFPFTQEIEISGVVKDSPADNAGIAAGDGVINFGDNLWQWENHPAPTSWQKGFERLADFKQILRGAFNENAALSFMLQRGVTRQQFLIKSEQVCLSEFEVSSGGNLTAGANGIKIRISMGLMNYAPNDDELSVVVAHEMAHNLLRHRQFLKENGVSDGIGRIFGKSAKLRRGTEEQADRLAIWLIYNAGYDPQSAINFWIRYGKEHGQGIFTEPTHDRWKNRVKFINEEISAIHKMKLDNEKLMDEKGFVKLDPPLLSAFRIENILDDGAQQQ
ncbi:hypothetical protein LPB140_05260 [Sphingorhabdus lutea]|uniref:Peptidase M48 domain-containing protein n=1 Tax=Sphingorhabdus lutea TaxID=1913578 RepID=A0A1L3JB09_9SPHN|nr:M48 family metallopeptidase [Sphingorhabdus lutea]APG62311.1 hypothetical protein LPB140_05260 [Sphingorhabdus lutea]